MRHSAAQPKNTGSKKETMKVAFGATPADLRNVIKVGCVVPEPANTCPLRKKKTAAVMRVAAITHVYMGEETWIGNHNV